MTEKIVQKSSTPPETLLETLSILSILITRFPAHMSTMTLQPPPVQVMIPLLSHSRPAVRKRAIVTLGKFNCSAEWSSGLTTCFSTIPPELRPGSN